MVPAALVLQYYITDAHLFDVRTSLHEDYSNLSFSYVVKTRDPDET